LKNNCVVGVDRALDIFGSVCPHTERAALLFIQMQVRPPSKIPGVWISRLLDQKRARELFIHYFLFLPLRDPPQHPTPSHVGERGTELGRDPQV